MTTMEVALASLVLVSSCSAAALFEESHAVPMPVAQWGYRGMPGDIVELKDGKLLICYTREGVQGRVSEDQGRTWGEELVLVPNPQPPSRKGYYCHPSFVRLANGDILLSYIYAAEALPYYGHNYYRRSADEGKTWSEQFLMTPYPGYAIVHNDKVRVLSDGRIIAAAEYKKRWPSERDHSGYVAMCFYSDDDGYSWHPSTNDVDMDPHEAQEAHVVELRDGRVMMLFRTYSGFIGRSYSSDRSGTWSPGELVEDLPISANACAVTVERIPSTGDLVLFRTTAGEGGKRTPLTAAVSKDEGETWGPPRVIAGDPEDDYGYQSVDFIGDVAVVSYHRRNGLWVARIGAEWFYEGE